MQARLHRMRQAQRRDSARTWINSGAHVTIKTYAKRYGVDKYTSYEDLSAVGFALPASTPWAHRPPSVAKKPAEKVEDLGDDWWVLLDGRRFFVAGYTSGGVPYGVFEDEFEDASGVLRP